jgi:hypothetical protein
MAAFVLPEIRKNESRSRLLELAFVLVRFDHVASRIIMADHRMM